MPRPALAKRAVAEFLGTGFLVAAVVGSGIMGESLAPGSPALVLLVNTLATGAALVALILGFGPISGGHFNPAVTIADASQRGILWSEVPAYIAAQISGGVAGTLLAHAMFALPLVSLSQHRRAGAAQALSEFVATFGLLAVIWGCAKFRTTLVAFAVAAYIMAGYWFTASTSFANPAVSIARSLTDTFSGIRPIDVPAFIGAQLLGALAATFTLKWLICSHGPAEVIADHTKRSTAASAPKTQ